MTLKPMSLALGAILLASPSLAASLPNGTCTGGGMTVTVQGGKIVSYRYGGRSYAVAALSAAKYKIGTAGTLAVSSPKPKSFKGVFSMGGRNTNAKFTCK